MDNIHQWKWVSWTHLYLKSNVWCNDVVCKRSECGTGICFLVVIECNGGNTSPLALYKDAWLILWDL